MKIAAAVSALLAGYLVLEAQPPGSGASANLGPAFDTPREIKTVKAKDDLKSIRLVSWNIDRGTQLDLVASGLEREPADLCLLQEVDWNTLRSAERDVAAELARRLHLNLAYGVEFEELGQEHGRPAFIGQASLTRLPIRQARILRFQNQSGYWKPHSWMPASIPVLQRRLGSRIALVTELEFRHHLLVVYNVHLESRSLGKLQEAQLDEILADLARYPTGTAAILAGDLNTKYFPSRYLRKLEARGFHSVLGERVERTHAIAMALDWIFASGPLQIEDGRVRRDLHGSDHYPIYADVIGE